MLVKGDLGRLKAHILIKFGYNIPIHSKYVWFLLVPKYQYSLYHFKWCVFKLLTDLYFDQSKVKEYYEFIPSTFMISETPQIVQTCANLLALRSVKWFSFSDRLFLMWWGWHQLQPCWNDLLFHCALSLYLHTLNSFYRWYSQMNSLNAHLIIDFCLHDIV